MINIEAVEGIVTDQDVIDAVLDIKRYCEKHSAVNCEECLFRKPERGRCSLHCPGKDPRHWSVEQKAVLVL